ncbi:MAG: ABC transporter ATP-binding protein [Massilibacteroides sp.]|nr:ABC transporter ATP-binding protein [Massilibacteroides sp.]MDD3061813.1 ABC transporter ATP-binding protein [Massilibacteroides sp.]MDD4115414.1 ABC transporter ATP-binding protein [Massilibacteroides sp.]MDD4660095.1 ABC transporter ATP-binding protein [Massilibacteroides sp.]
MEKRIEIRNVSAAYGAKTVLHNISLDIFEKDFLGIIGPNGGGKTTLLKVILGLLSPRTGQVTFYKSGQAVSSLKIGYLPQINHIDKKFPISVWEVVASGLAEQKPFLRAYTKVQEQRVEEVLEQMGVNEFVKRPIGELSGGQLQRVLLGRAIVSCPEVLILDEPNSYVDKRFESHFYDLLEGINKESAIVLVSHDIGTVVSMVKNIACVNETLHYHPGTDVTEDWLTHVYNCPIDLVGHGNLPHRVLKTHED